MVISIKHYQSKKNLYFLLNSFIFCGLNGISTFSFSLFHGGIFSRRVLFTFHLCSQNQHVLRQNTQEEFNREKKNYSGPPLSVPGDALSSLWKLWRLCSSNCRFAIWTSSSSSITRLRSRAYYIIVHYEWFQCQNKHFSGKWIISVIHFDRKLYHCRYFATSYLSKSKFW